MGNCVPAQSAPEQIVALTKKKVDLKLPAKNDLYKKRQTSIKKMRANSVSKSSFLSSSDDNTSSIRAIPINITPKNYQRFSLCAEVNWSNTVGVE